jgi:calnexin
MKVLSCVCFAVLAVSSAIAADVEEPAVDLDIPATTYDVPTFTSGFLESFQSDPLAGAWSLSKEDAYANQDWAVKAPKAAAPLYAADTGFRVEKKAQRYGVSASLEKPVTLGEQSDELVISYELRMENGLECGGAYLKLLSDDANFVPDELDGDSQYSIMFGPDKCGNTNKVHFIYRHLNPVSKEWEEKHLKAPPAIKNDNELHLYTLVIRKNLDFQILIDNVEASAGSMADAETFDPPLLPPEEIDDPTDKKPADWVDDAEIDDPEASKPDDWDEDAPRKIEDASAEKPTGWCDDCPEEIPDPEAEMPEDWDEEEDGEWEAPIVANPACNIGCGEWQRPTIDNPDYKGKWNAPKIPNPDYIGEWAPARIQNPAYFSAETHPDAVAAPIATISHVSIEIWTMSDGLMFDNIVVSHSVDDTFAFIGETWEKKVAEEAAFKTRAQRAKDKQARLDAWENGGVAGKISYFAGEVGTLIIDYPIPTVITIIALFGGMIYWCLSGDDDDDVAFTPPPPPAPKKEEDANEGTDDKATQAKEKDVKEDTNADEEKKGEENKSKKKKKKKKKKSDNKKKSE